MSNKVKVAVYTLGDLMTNCYCLYDRNDALLIDPGGPSQELIEFFVSQKLNLRYIINTHGHGDHIDGNRMLQERYGVPILIHAADRRMLLSATANLSAFFGPGVVSPDAARTLEDRETVPLGEESLEVLATPGHSPGSICLYKPGLLFSGDTLFRESVGRTDFPGGDSRVLLTGIRERLLVLPPETVVLPGHGAPTTIGHEQLNNPFLAGIDAL